MPVTGDHVADRHLIGRASREAERSQEREQDQSQMRPPREVQWRRVRSQCGEIDFILDENDRTVCTVRVGSDTQEHERRVATLAAAPDFIMACAVLIGVINAAGVPMDGDLKVWAREVIEGGELLDEPATVTVRKAIARLKECES